LVSAIVISLVLLYDSIRDFKYRTIDRKSIIVVYIIALAMRFIIGFSTQGTFSFIFLLIAFVSFSVLTKGNFGMGDSLLIGGLGLFLGYPSEMLQFVYAMGACGIAIWVFYFIKNKDYKNIRNLFKSTKVTTVSIDEVKVGSVLASDNFMAGLTVFDIQNLKNSGVKEIQIKQQPLPFIPCIFVAFLLALLV